MIGLLHTSLQVTPGRTSSFNFECDPSTHFPSHDLVFLLGDFVFSKVIGACLRTSEGSFNFIGGHHRHTTSMFSGNGDSFEFGKGGHFYSFLCGFLFDV
jgi:hypothetical protein